jgi:hypothetical protein
MKTRLARVSALIILSTMLPLYAQDNPQQAATPSQPQDAEQPNRFWQANLPGGHYMVALDRISSVSRHRYVLDGALIVDEVTIDALGQSLARFYYIEPITSSAGGAAGEAARRLVDRGSELADRAAGRAGTAVHEMVVKKFPETTHARTVEYRLLSEEELSALHKSVRNAWENNRGRRFSVK